jgi:hypothetical protein
MIIKDLPPRFDPSIDPSIKAVSCGTIHFVALRGPHDGKPVVKTIEMIQKENVIMKDLTSSWVHSFHAAQFTSFFAPTRADSFSL